MLQKKFVGGHMIDALAEELSLAVVDLQHVLRRTALRLSGREPLPEAQLAVLRAVERRPGIGVGGVAEAIRTAHNTASTLVGTLTDAGLLERTRDPDNRRCVQLRLTELSQVRLAEQRALRAELLDTALCELDAPARESLAAALPHLIHLAEVLERVSVPEMGATAR
jgi:DNA-binding MarR family transcriptional regulator